MIVWHFTFIKPFYSYYLIELTQQSYEVSEGIIISTVQISIPWLIYVKKVFRLELKFQPACSSHLFIYLTEFVDY